MKFTSNRLLFKLVEEDDYQAITELFSDEKVMQYALIDYLKNDIEKQAFFQQMISRKTNSGLDWIAFSVFEKTDQQAFVGLADFELNKQEPTGNIAELGYFITPAQWGKRYATEICRQLIEVCFNDFAAHKVYACCHAENAGSEGTMKKAGMTKEAEIQQHRFKNGKWVNELRYVALKSNWK